MVDSVTLNLNVEILSQKWPEAFIVTVNKYYYRDMGWQTQSH